MAVKTLEVSSTQSWIYPPLTYTGYDNVHKLKNHWYNGHSRLEVRGYKCYQAGNTASDGQYNGNMMCFFFFRNGSQTLKQFIQSIGGSSKITKIVLKVTCGHSWYSSMNARVCLTPYWSPEKKWGQGGISEAPYDSYDKLKIKHLTTVSIPKGKRVSIDLTRWKGDFDKYESLNFYVPGAFNKDYAAYGWVHGHKASASQRPQLEIHYNTNSAPNKPTIEIKSHRDSSGYMAPKLDCVVKSNGDPDNNIHSSPYYLELRNQSGSMFFKSGWDNFNNYSVDLEKYRGQTVNVKGYVRDREGLYSDSNTNVYINTRPYWKNLGANATAIEFTGGVNNGVFSDQITISWPRAVDDQSQHNNNLRYAIYCQKGIDNGPEADNYNCCVVRNLTSTSYTFDASSMIIPVAKGERVYFSVWVDDGLEWSSYRLCSSWIYREKPPSSPTNVAPISGHYENNVNVSWSASSGANGTWVDHYLVKLLNKDGTVMKTYTPRETQMVCSDLTVIPRGEIFKFSVCSVDNLGNESTLAYSGDLRRNSAPTKPYNFKINADRLEFKGSIPLIWSASSDKDNDPIKYNVYFNVNGGAYQELVRGTSSTTLTHDISGFTPGVKFNYFVEAYDSFNVYSDRTYIANEPVVNTPPGSPEIVLPYSDVTLFTNVPRIIFRTGTIHNNNKLEVIITVNGKQYSSKVNSTLFNKPQYDSNEEGMFMIPSDTPLNYTKSNTIKIKTFDGMDVSLESSRKLSVEATPVNRIGEDEIRFIQAYEADKLRDMINSNRFAYGLSQVTWIDGRFVKDKTKVFKKYFEQIVNEAFVLTSYLNDKAKCEHLKRVYIKNSIVGKINRNIFNNVYDMITKC